MDIQAILFGAIGTIVETSEIQREAFNRAFEEAELDWHWDKQAYADMLKKSGGKQRIQDYADAREQDVNAVALHERKTEIYNKAIVEEGLSPREGVLELMSWAGQNKVKLGFATTTSRNNIEAIFMALDDALLRSHFHFVGDGGIVTNSKPDPEIYHEAMTVLNLKPEQCLAIEDTGVSMKSALNAGINCVAFPGEYADRQDFEGAHLIVNRVDPLTLGLSQADDSVEMSSK